MIVELSLSELQQAILVGGQRQLRAIRARRSEPYGHPSERGSWDVIMEGVAAEMAVAKALDLYWRDDPKLDYGGDVGSLQVRSTDVPNGHLLIYPRDSDDAYFVLAVGRAPTFEIASFILGREAKSDAYWEPTKLRVPCWMVPQTALDPIDALSRQRLVA